ARDRIPREAHRVAEPDAPVLAVGRMVLTRALRVVAPDPATGGQLRAGIRPASSAAVGADVGIGADLDEHAPAVVERDAPADVPLGRDAIHQDLDRAGHADPLGG